MQLARRLERAFEDGTSPWLPGWAPRLAEEKWVELRSCGITPESYGTARIRAGTVTVERDVRAALPLPEGFGRTGNLLFETLHGEVAARYVDLGLDLASPDLAASDIIVLQVGKALDTLARVPSIAASIGPVLHVLHVAIPEEPDYDVSFSDPEVPFSIFVGVSPDADGGPVSRLRLAEGMLHEVMHLQLSLVEGILPLVADETSSHFSPWQGVVRPVRGILHGAYVFAVIRELMRGILNDDRSADEERIHAKKRIETIDREIEAAVWPMLRNSGLSPAGRQLVERCML